jgi:hypothetical protein
VQCVDDLTNANFAHIKSILCSRTKQQRTISICAPTSKRVLACRDPQWSILLRVLFGLRRCTWYLNWTLLRYRALISAKLCRCVCTTKSVLPIFAGPRNTVCGLKYRVKSLPVFTRAKRHAIDNLHAQSSSRAWQGGLRTALLA